MDKEIKEIETTLNDSKEVVEQAISFLPAKYQILYAVLYMLESVNNLRADTLKDAINLYENHLSDLEFKGRLNQIQAQELQIMNSFIEKMENNQAEMSSDIADIKNMQYYEWIKKS